jgi:hypothetical protein
MLASVGNGGFIALTPGPSPRGRGVTEPKARSVRVIGAGSRQPTLYRSNEI